MQTYFKRAITDEILIRLKNNPVVAILGPRQCGKSTLAKKIISNKKDTLYLDLENPSDLNKLNDPISFFKINKNRLVCIDEIQRRPELFPALRSIIDESGKNGQILILGSASRDLIKQSSETLAGRISYIELSPFLINEIPAKKKNDTLYRYWLRGGFPRSYLSENDRTSMQWRNDFMRTYLERDIPQLGFNIPAQSMRRLWQMCAHSHGQLLNSSKFGDSLGISNHTVRRYIDILEQSFLVRVLQPCEMNFKKRIIKSPRVFIRDQGILHALLDIDNMNDLMGHPVYGSSWEGMAIEQIVNYFPDWRSSFYRSSSGSEIDLILERGRKRIAIEFKASSSPEVAKGFWNSLNDLKIKNAFIVAPVESAYPLTENVVVCSLFEAVGEIGKNIY